MTKTNTKIFRIYRWDIPGYEYTPDGDEKLVDEGFNEFIGDGFDSIDDAVEAVENYVKALNTKNDGRNTVIVQRNLDRHDRRRLCRVHLQVYGFTPEREAEKAIELETTWKEGGEEMCTTSYVEIFSANW